MASPRVYAPRPIGVRDPRDPHKRNGIAWNPPRFQFFGGVQQPYNQAGDRPLKMGPALGQSAVGPISDRGRGRA